MAIPVPTIWADNTIPLASQFNTDIKGTVNFLRSVPRAQVMHNATIQRTTGGPTSNGRTNWSVLPWNVDIDKTDGSAMHNTSTNNSRIIAQTAGVYHVWANITWEDHTSQSFDGDRGIQIRKNSAGAVGTGTLIGVDHRHCKTQLFGGQGATQQGCEGYVSMAVNDYLEVFVYDADDDVVPIVLTACGCFLEPQTWFAQRFGMRWVSI